MVIGMTIFRANSLDSLGEMGTAIFSNFHPEVLPQFVAGYWLVVLIIVVAFVVHFLPDRWYPRLIDAYDAMPMVLQTIILAIVLFLVIQTRQSSLVPFIYLQY